MISPEHVLFVDVKMSTVDKYYLNTKDGRTTTRDRDVVANYESNDRKKLLLFIGLLVRTYVSIKNLSFMDNEELTPNVLNQILEAILSVKHVSLIHCRQFIYETMYSFDVLTRILEAMPTVDYVSLIQCRQFSYDTIHCLAVSNSAPELHLECTISHNFAAGTLFNGNSPTQMWVYLQRYRSRMTGEPLEQEEDPDEEYLAAYGTAATLSDTRAEPSYEKLRIYNIVTHPQIRIKTTSTMNHMIGIESSAESLLANQIKTNPNFLRHCSQILMEMRPEAAHIVSQCDGRLDQTPRLLKSAAQFN